MTPIPTDTDALAALPTAFDSTTCTRRGLCPVTHLRHQDAEPLESHSLYYELHGRGTRHKVVFIMGLNSSSFAWGPQVRYFGRDGFDGPGEGQEGGERWVEGRDKSAVGASLLVFDNRGVGNSGYPMGPYTTSGMAEDLICLLGEIGWTGERELNVVGVSLGGMIAQELASRIPHRIASLVLSVTTPGGHFWNNLPPISGLTSLMRLMFTTDPPEKVRMILDMLYPPEWLDEKAEDDPEGRTNRAVQTEEYLRRIAITKPQQFLGHISQMCSGLTHRVTPDRLRAISASIPKVTIVTGDTDNLVNPANSYRLKDAMPEAELVVWEGTGHGINHQRSRKFNELCERTWEEGRRRMEEDPIKWGGPAK